jgi:hypothetical protein
MTRLSETKKRFGSIRSIQVCGALLALLATSSAAAPAVQEVDLKLVLAVDVSGSINTEEFTLEREGTADAFADPDVIKAIRNGALGRIAVTMIDFSSPEYDKVVIDWQIIKDKTSAEAFAALIRDTPRSPGRRTSVSSALELGSLLIESSAGEIHATRNVIDVSGDGPNNDGNPMQEAHDKVISQGIVVNGLPVMDDNANGYYPDLDKYYAGCVVGGRGAFVIVVRKYSDFMAAMRHKLILEVSQDQNQIRQTMNELQDNELIRKIAASGAGPNSPPQVLRPTNGYPGGCDMQRGFGGYGRFR